MGIQWYGYIVPFLARRLKWYLPVATVRRLVYTVSERSNTYFSLTINHYNSMKFLKFMSAPIIAVALFGSLALAANAETTATTPATNRPRVDLACMVNAVGKREAAIGAAFSTFSSAMQSALSARQSALAAAWALTDAKARRAGIRSAWETFRKAKRQARLTHNAAIKAAWSTFRTDAKACHGTASEESSGQGQDNL